MGGELAAVRCDLEDFAAEMFEPFARADQRRWGAVYLRGLLMEGRRKSVEPMAARLGQDGNRQALANFITTSPWDAAHVRARLAWRMQQVIKPTALILDDTGFLKDGDASACVARQYTGTAGKVTNCQAGVSLHLACDSASVAVDWRLFLPESWDPASPKTDPGKVARRTTRGIPEEVGHVEKWQEALGTQMLALLLQLEATSRAADDLAAAVEEAFLKHPDAEVILSFPGLGVQLGARVLAEVGDDRSRFADARGLKAYAGSSPVTRASGKKSSVTRRWVKNDRLNHAGYLWAFSAVNGSPGTKAHYRRRRDEHGDWHAAAQRNLFNRMIGQLYHCLQHRTLFDENTAFPSQLAVAT